METNGVDEEDEDEELLYANSDHVDVKICDKLAQPGILHTRGLTVQHFGPSYAFALCCCRAVNLDDESAISREHQYMPNTKEQGDVHDVQNNKRGCKVPCSNAIDFSLPCEVPYHSAEYHVDKCIRPKRCHQYQDEPSSIVSKIRRCVDTDNPEYISYQLPKSAHSDDPGIGFAVVNALSDVCYESKTKEDSKCISCSHVRTETPQSVRRGHRSTLV